MRRTLEEIEKDVAELSPDQLASFRTWFQAFDEEAWDRQIESDSGSGKLDHLADRALAEHKTGRTKRL